MKKFFKTLCCRFGIQYRLAVFNEDKAAPANVYSLSRKFMHRYIRRLDVPYWTLYRRGPFGIGERPIDWGGYMHE